MASMGPRSETAASTPAPQHARTAPRRFSSTIPKVHLVRILKYASRLESHGGVLITAPKAVGKTTTARTFAASEVRLDQDRAALTAARTDPRVRIAATPKRHLADPSLAVAALGATPARLLGPEIEWAGFLFESQVARESGSIGTTRASNHSSPSES